MADINTVTVEELNGLRSTMLPFWCADLIDTLKDKDPLDAWRWMDVLTHAYRNKLDAMDWN